MSETINIDTLMKNWEATISYIEEGGDIPYAMLNLARIDLNEAIPRIKCKFCKRQAEIELKLVNEALEFARMANQWLYTDSKRTKIQLAFKATIKIIKIFLIQLRKAFI